MSRLYYYILVFGVSERSVGQDCILLAGFQPASSC